MVANKVFISASDLLGASRLAVEATVGVTDVVEAMHGTIVRIPFLFGAPKDTRTRGITRLVYQCIRTVARLVGGGVDALLTSLVPLLDESDSSQRRENLVAVLNGVSGDHLAASSNPLAIPMRIRSGGRPLELSKDGLAAAGAPVTGKLLVLVHGLGMSDLQWSRRGHNHGEALARERGYTPLYLHYNSGQHVSINGRRLAALMEALLACWPLPLDELLILGYSMGGLVARSACHHARLGGQRWPEQLDRLIFLGTPHHGAPFERAGNLFELLLEATPYAAPLARIGGIRSAGITDLRYGNVRDEDWDGRHRRYHHDPRTPLPLPDGVQCYAVAASKSARRPAEDSEDELPGDGLVPVASALGRHPEARLSLSFPASQRSIAYATGHLDLLSAPGVYETIKAWLDLPRPRRRAP